mmetsp:Transcript_68967/g.164508  ORF Transcript_68967/g.164508 Transcript_68967/m.164508 type:complete len:201 (-) Transcript_68967:966-1568(-)
MLVARGEERKRAVGVDARGRAATRLLRGRDVECRDAGHRRRVALRLPQRRHALQARGGRALRLQIARLRREQPRQVVGPLAGRAHHREVERLPVLFRDPFGQACGEEVAVDQPCVLDEPHAGGDRRGGRHVHGEHEDVDGVGDVVAPAILETPVVRHLHAQPRQPGDKRREREGQRARSRDVRALQKQPLGIHHVHELER